VGQAAEEGIEAGVKQGSRAAAAAAGDGSAVRAANTGLEEAAEAIGGSAIRAATFRFRLAARTFRDMLGKIVSWNRQVPFSSKIHGYKEMEEILPLLDDIEDIADGKLLEGVFDKGIKTLAFAGNEAYQAGPTKAFWDEASESLYRAIYGQHLGPMRRIADRAAKRTLILSKHIGTLRSFRSGLEAGLRGLDGLPGALPINRPGLSQLADMRKAQGLLRELDDKLIFDEPLRHLIDDGLLKLNRADEFFTARLNALDNTLFPAKTGLNLATETKDPSFWKSLTERLYQIQHGDVAGMKMLEDERILEASSRL
jgi:hypothetical protein